MTVFIPHPVIGVLHDSWDTWKLASYGNHLPLWLVQAVQALPGVDEIMALDKELFFL